MALINEEIEALTIDELRSRKTYKWSTRPRAIDVSIAEFDFPVSVEITNSLQHWAKEGCFGYVSPSFADELRTATCAWLTSSYGFCVDPSAVQLVPDVIRAFEASVDMLQSPTANIVIPTPAYGPFLTIAGKLGRPVVEVPMLSTPRGYRLDLTRVADELAPGGLFLLCNPHNPTGTVHSRQDLEVLSSIVSEKDARVFSDEIYAPIVFDGHTHISYADVNEAARAHTVTAVSASKAWGLSGLKCAQVVLSNDTDIAIWNSKMPSIARGGASAPGIVATLAAYQRGDLWLRRTMSHLEYNRRLLSDLVSTHLPAAHYIPPGGTFLAWIDCRNLIGTRRPGRFFLETANVHTVDGYECGASGAGYVRVNFGTSDEILRMTVESMAEAVYRRRTL
ncbi:MalY/PatB family protein [Nocardia abscessus]|uniref:MalY/PatB family protein n=1 Tax=Nocardia abscessus TaxID=120957 RepID=UPI0024540ED9|nr:aminotransferase class I/II-fold pyridoxal phosphate-dependent enzyme [Nocardia abscessus]